MPNVIDVRLLEPTKFEKSVTFLVSKPLRSRVENLQPIKNDAMFVAFDVLKLLKVIEVIFAYALINKDWLSAGA